MPDEERPRRVEVVNEVQVANTKEHSRLKVEARITNKPKVTIIDPVPTTSSRQRWEITRLGYQGKTDSTTGLAERMKFEKDLEMLAADGWELVGVAGNEMFFKRPK